MKRKGTVPVAPQSSSRKPQCQSYVGYGYNLQLLGNAIHKSSFTIIKVTLL